MSALSAQDAPAFENANFMKKPSNKSARKPMRDEYDFSQGERGKYARRYAQGTNVVVLEPDVAKVFSNSKSVNISLRNVHRLGVGENLGDIRLQDNDVRSLCVTARV